MRANLAGVVMSIAFGAVVAGCGGSSGLTSGGGGDPGTGGGGTTGTTRCGRTTPDPGSGDLFARARYGMVGTWRGTATSPWVAPYTVEISFGGDGMYDAHTVDPGAVGYAVTPFYYDQDPEHDRYELVDLHANGEVSGQIYLQWLDSPDRLDAIRFNDELTHLHFEYYHFDYGPVVYDLDCAE
jgi:hypothetical protein